MCTPLPGAGAAPAAEGDPGEPVLPFRVAAAVDRSLPGLPSNAAMRRGARTMFAERTNWNLEANRLSAALARQRAAGKPLLDLSASNPTACGFDYDRAAILQALANPAALRYEPDARGLESARRAVAGYYAGRKAEVAAEEIFLTTSTSEAYTYVFRTLCNPGDELLAPEPTYPLFGFLADIQDGRVAPAELPSVEERRPVNEGDQIAQRDVHPPG